MPLAPFEIDRKALDSGVVVLALTGTMTMGTQLQKFEETVTELTKEDRNRIVVDMSGISYLDSSALGVLVACHVLVKKANGQLRLAALTDRVAKIVKLVGVDAVLLIDPTRDAAVAGFASNA